MFDVAIVGGGPAGASCAAFCAAAGLRTVIIEREKFPREKVCGDCINPACWPVLRRLEVAQQIRALPHGNLERVEFIGIGGRAVSVELPAGDDAEIAVKRSLFDQVLLGRARELGVEVFETTTVTALSSPDPRADYWRITAGGETLRARTLVAADGRNSTIARLCGLLPHGAKERIALQTHLPLPADFGNRIVLEFRPEGYSGQAPVGDSTLNLCLVSVPRKIRSLREWAQARFGLSMDYPWRTITPLTREPISPGQPALFLAGDAASVVEPFTGEGIYYALASGELAAKAIRLLCDGGRAGDVAVAYSSAHAQLYRGRLWINRLARAAVVSPRLGSAFLSLASLHPALLRALTRRIVWPGGSLAKADSNKVSGSRNR
ncbi:MAG TPA: NAD(P)/FAD-dependent oxidoreductase [Chthoniobacterales bacterium]|jgi:geranylgeranyl reductase family protein|nr:NAD(P)/FAD-dependent oxidoreductase [Chthoniobacterales bacterium]